MFDHETVYKDKGKSFEIFYTQWIKKCDGHNYDDRPSVKDGNKRFHRLEPKPCNRLKTGQSNGKLLCVCFKYILGVCVGI